MDPLNQIRLRSLMNTSLGSKGVVIGLIDGPVNLNHKYFENSNIRTVKETQIAVCKNDSSIACAHGTFVAGILCSKRGTVAPGICPGCDLVLNPIFSEGDIQISGAPPYYSHSPSSITAEDLAEAIIDVIDVGAKIINLSMASSSNLLTRKLVHVYDYACQKDVVIVMASGNHLTNYNSLITHPWLIPVAACDENSMPSALSNFGLLIGRKGLMAPGINIMSASPEGDYTKRSGTSFATPFVTGAIALLWSMFPEAKAEEVVYCVLANPMQKRNSIVPPLLNAEHALSMLKIMLRK